VDENEIQTKQKQIRVHTINKLGCIWRSENKQNETQIHKKQKLKKIIKHRTRGSIVIKKTKKKN